MSRQRLSWDKEKVAEITKQADPYTMNQERSNPPAEKYVKGDPETFGEGQDHTHRWEGEGRTEDGHPAPSGEQGAAPVAVAPVAAPAPEAGPTPEREAIVQAHKLEDKALKCITIAQRMLPGATDSVIEDQATEFMFLPERSVMATLQRQTELATKIAAEQCEEKEEKEEKKEEKPAEAPVAEKPVEAKEEEKEEKEEKPAEDAKPAEAPAAEVPAAEAKPVEASDKDLLDILFDSAEIIPEVKTGAKKLSGLVKQASNSDPLSGLWNTPPDISDVFK